MSQLHWQKQQLLLIASGGEVKTNRFILSVLSAAKSLQSRGVGDRELGGGQGAGGTGKV